MNLAERDAAQRTIMRPFWPSVPDFAAGTDTPRDFLERCLAAIAAREEEINAFVTLDIGAARATADAASERWRAGRPLSAIDGLPLGVKDIIESADMPTQMGSPLFAGWRSERDAASVLAMREAGAVILGKTVTTEFAATEPGPTRNPRDPRRTPGGSSSGSAAGVAAGFISAGLGTQVVGSIVRPASFCGCVGFKPSVGALNRGGSHDGLSQSATGVLAASLEDAWQIAFEIGQRAGGDPGFPGLAGPPLAPTPRKPQRLALLETAGWASATDEAKQALAQAAARLADAGIAIVDRRNVGVAALEAAIADAFALSIRINTWETRWPLNTYRNRDARKLSQAMLARLANAETMTIDEYRVALDERARIRRIHAALASACDACVTLSASGAAPLTLASTGNPAFAVPGSLLGVPALSLPLLEAEHLPLGLQVLGFENADADAFAVAAWLRDALAPDRQ